MFGLIWFGISWFTLVSEVWTSYLFELFLIRVLFTPGLAQFRPATYVNSSLMVYLWPSLVRIVMNGSSPPSDVPKPNSSSSSDRKSFLLATENVRPRPAYLDATFITLTTRNKDGVLIHQSTGHREVECVFTCMLPVPPVVGPAGVVVVVQVVVRRQQVTNPETVSVLQSHVRTQAISTDR